jgi:hypothetical protein
VPATPLRDLQAHAPRPAATPPLARADARTAPSVGNSTALATSSQSLEAEVRTLRRVERALREQNPRLAFELLGELDRVVPGGELAEERLAAFSIARCALGAGAPTTITREFVKSYPSSVYLARVQQACAVDPAP